MPAAGGALQPRGCLNRGEVCERAFGGGGSTRSGTLPGGHGQIESQPLRSNFWERDALRQSLGRPEIGFILLAHHYLKPALTVQDDPAHLLILRCGDIRQPDLDRPAAAFGFGADPVDPPRALLESARIPAQIVVDDVPAVQVQVDAFSQYAACDEDLRVEGSVECEHESASGLRAGSPVDQPDVWDQRLQVRAIEFII